MSALTGTPLFTLRELSERAGGELRMGAAPETGTGPESGIEGVAIDTRALKRGELFVPLAGSRADGHDFLAEAFRRGARAALCARDHYEPLAGREPGPLVVVEDVTAALQRLAREHRRSWTGLVIGITGSSGKTTTKDLVARVLAAAFPTLATRGNLNNHWGVPLTLLELRPEHRVAVVEMGSNHPGEIGLLAAIAAPGAAVITNAGSAHLEHFGSLSAIAQEKASLAFALEDGRPLFAGADSPALLEALAGARCRVVTFGLSPRAQVRPLNLEDLGPAGSRFEVRDFPPVRLSLVGRHQVANALAALAVARELAVDPAAAVHALESYRPMSGRMEIRRAGGVLLLVDCYNANPESTRAALETLASWPGASRRVAILGDMLELGEESPRLHREVGAAVRGAELWSVGERAADYAAGAREADVEVRIFPDPRAVSGALREILEPGVVVLLKASRGAALERVLDGLETEA